ncbi:hypothetical protein DFJ77DRAFT_317310 [Powellomyces hirtus]|nr:hypothetical protein DFJ77DRAFT_317310 [Powellomyces hirtus]
MHWRSDYLDIRAKQKQRSILLKKFFHMWLFQWQEKMHNVLSTRLYRQRRCGLLFRKWLWKTWESIAPDCIEYLQMDGQWSAEAFLEDKAMRAVFVTKQIPEDIETFQRLDRVGRILSTTDVQTTIYSEPALCPPEGYAHRAKWRASVMQVHELTEKRRAEYAAANAIYLPRLLKRTFIFWIQHQRSTRVFNLRALEMAHARNRTSLRAAVATWRESLQRVEERRNSARIAYSWNLRGHAFETWKQGLQRRRQDEETAGTAHKIACLMQAWHKWRGKHMANKLAQRKRLNKELAANYRRDILLKRGFHHLRILYTHRRNLTHAAVQHDTYKHLHTAMRAWIAKASLRILLDQAAHTAQQTYHINLQRQMLRKWGYKTYLVFAARELEERVGARNVGRMFMYWKYRWLRKCQLARKMAALRRLRNLMIEDRCKRLFAAWRGLTVKRKSLDLAEREFAHRLHGIYRINTAEDEDDHHYGVAESEGDLIPRTRNVALLKQCMALWAAKCVEQRVTQFSDRSSKRGRWIQWTRWISERKITRAHSEGCVVDRAAYHCKRRVFRKWIMRLVRRRAKMEAMLRAHEETRRRIILPRLFGKWLRRMRALKGAFLKNTGSGEICRVRYSG